MADILVRKIHIDPDSLTLAIGETAKLTAYIDPSNATCKDVQWTVPQGSVASVDQDGNVIARRSGSSRIIAKSVDGNAIAWIPVTVAESVVHVNGVKLSAVNLYLGLNQTAKLIATVTPSNATNKNIKWSQDVSAVCRVDQEGNVLAQRVGVGTVVARSEDGGYMKSCSVVVTRDPRPTPDPDDPDDPQPPTPSGDDDIPVIPDVPDIPDDPTDPDVVAGGKDYIYRIDYEKNDDGSDNFTSTLLFNGNLGFDTEHPIESVVYYENEDIQKIYWVDGKNVLRFMNFMEKEDARGYYPWQTNAGTYDGTYFDSNRKIKFGIKVDISKENSGNTRANGVAQYFITYYNKHGQESGYAWVSDLVYLSPVGFGGAADDTNNNAVTLSISGLDTRFSNFRVYQLFRSSLNGVPVAYIVADMDTTDSTVTIVDDGAHLVNEDPQRLLYLGSQNVIAGTLTHKDDTLFVGDLQSIGKEGYDEIEAVIKATMVGKDGIISFDYSSGDGEFGDIPLKNADSSTYSYENQLTYTSSEITTFKGGEKYRFALSFIRQDGTQTEAFWIGDAVNPLYPKMTSDGVHRAIAKCVIPNELYRVISKPEYKLSAVRLMIAEATYADRSVKAQGIVNPTVFNVWERYNDRLYAQASWISRPRNSGFAWKHFEAVHNANTTTGEIQCNYWTPESSPNPYYRIENYSSSNAGIYGSFDGIPKYDYYKIIYRIGHMTGQVGNNFWAGYQFVGVQMNNHDISELAELDLTENLLESPGDYNLGILVHVSERALIYATGSLITNGTGFVRKVADKLWPDIYKAIRESYGADTTNIVDNETFATWFRTVYDMNAGSDGIEEGYFNYCFINHKEDDWEGAFNYSSGSVLSGWYDYGDHSISGGFDYTASYYKQHMMFVDENVVTLNSPEITYEAVDFDAVDTTNYKFRIVGAVKITSEYSDYVVNAVPGKLPGENLVSNVFSSLDLNGLLSYPLWKEYGLAERIYEEEDKKTEYSHAVSEKENWTSYDYVWGGNIVRYWLYMWNHVGKINGFTDYYNNNYSELNSKTFANLRYGGITAYRNYAGISPMPTDSIRIFNQLSSQYVGMDIAGEKKCYDAYINQSLSLPGTHKYPIFYSSGVITEDNVNDSTTIGADVYSNMPVPITYGSTPHAVVALYSSMTDESYTQSVLPRLFYSERVVIDNSSNPPVITNPLIPWIDNKRSASYPYKNYVVLQGDIALENPNVISEGDQYLYIGELYYDFDSSGTVDTRYGGTSESAIRNNRFIPAGPQYPISVLGGENNVIYGNRGDTYFQRWDCMKTKPYSNGAVNNVIDITSAMLETHINIDGITDRQRGTRYIASIDTANYGSLNPVYTQTDNHIVQRDFDSDANLDSYRSSITWSLAKKDAAAIDEWTHVTLATNLKLDGDKGICRALRRFQNSIISFQDRGIAEILFNSRTQLTTTDGVPVEIGNSGKVDGKRYITNKYGCLNKWSIVEGKAALYFVDNINKSFCAFSGQGIENVSTKLGLSVWFRNVNSTEPWNPGTYDNIVSFYDRIHSDIYLVKADDADDTGSLVYNETLGVFTSFFDYHRIPMMADVDDRFISFRDGNLWLQNEGAYCNFFGHQYDFWTQYRVTPDPYGDKIWTNVEYRADFYRVLNGNHDTVVDIESDFTDDVNIYQKSETFDYMRFWDEYQTTADEAHYKEKPIKKFRVWRLAIPRCIRNIHNPHGLDRIRNPWMNLLFKKKYSGGTGNNQDLMQLHDVTVIYYE